MLTLNSQVTDMFKMTILKLKYFVISKIQAQLLSLVTLHASLSSACLCTPKRAQPPSLVTRHSSLLSSLITHHSLLLLTLLLLSPLGASTWNILVYMAADNSLYESAVDDLNTMESVVLPPGVRVTVQTDLPADHALGGASRWQIRQDSSTSFTSPLLQDLGEVNSGAPETLRSFIQWGLERYEAERTMLVIWSHGDSWFKADSGKWICPDDSAEDVLSVTNGDLKTVFNGIPKLDILLFDACSMQTIEVLTEVKNVADFVIGSEDLVPVKGFPYQTILPLFSQDLPAILDAIPELYTQSYDAWGAQNPSYYGLSTTCSVIRTSALPPLLWRLGDFAIRFKDRAPDLLKLYPELYSMNYGYCEVDLKELFNRISDAPLPDFLIGSAEAIIQLWNTALVSSSALNYDHEIGTASIWFPWDRSYFDLWWRIYDHLDFASTRWLSLLNQAYGPDTTDPLAVENYHHSVVLSSLQVEFTQPSDPDSLHYEITIDDGAEELKYLYPNFSERDVRASFPISGPGYYSIVAIDPDGNRSAAASSAFTFQEPKPGLIISPNPVQSRALSTLRWFLDDEADLKLEIFNLKGQRLIREDLKHFSGGEGSFLLSSIPRFHQLAGGIYIVKLRYGTRSLKAKILLK